MPERPTSSRLLDTPYADGDLERCLRGEVSTGECGGCRRMVVLDAVTGAPRCVFCRTAAATRAGGATPCETCGAPVGPLDGYPEAPGGRWDACPTCKLEYYVEMAGMERRKAARLTAQWKATTPVRPGKLARQNPATCTHARVEPRGSETYAYEYRDEAGQLRPLEQGVLQRGFCHHCRWEVCRTGYASPDPAGGYGAPCYEPWQTVERVFLIEGA